MVDRPAQSSSRVLLEFLANAEVRLHTEFMETDHLDLAHKGTVRSKLAFLDELIGHAENWVAERGENRTEWRRELADLVQQGLVMYRLGAKSG